VLGRGLISRGVLKRKCTDGAGEQRYGAKVIEIKLHDGNKGTLSRHLGMFRMAGRRCGRRDRARS
jgi:hypothetical protein